MRCQPKPCSMHAHSMHAHTTSTEAMRDAMLQRDTLTLGCATFSLRQAGFQAVLVLWSEEGVTTSKEDCRARSRLYYLTRSLPGTVSLPYPAAVFLKLFSLHKKEKKLKRGFFLLVKTTSLVAWPWALPFAVRTSLCRAHFGSHLWWLGSSAAFLACA